MAMVAIGRLDLVDDAPADVDVAAGDGFEPRHHPQQRGLAAAGGADQDARTDQSPTSKLIPLMASTPP